MELNAFFSELDQIFKTKNIEEAEKYVISKMEQVKSEKDIPALLAIANELGGIYRVTGRYNEAKKIYQVALDAVEILGLSGSAQHGTTLLNMASVLNEAGEVKEALKLYEEVQKNYEQNGINKEYRNAALFNNISHVYEKMDQIDDAIKYASKSLEIIRGLKGNEIELATSLTSLGARYIKKQKYDEAMKNLKEAENIFLSQSGKPNHHFAATLNSMGELYHKQGNKTQAVIAFKRAMEVIKENFGENKIYKDIENNLKSISENHDRNLNNSTCNRMSGLALSRAYFQEFGKPMIDMKFLNYKRLMAIGLVGEGSECFGYDDEISENHDFGPGFCIWLPDEVFREIGQKLREAYSDLPRTFMGKRRMETAEGAGRVGVFSIEAFYKKYIGSEGIPKDNIGWLIANETSLATATNGEVFEDNLGDFTKIRNGLLDFYPRDVFLKKIAARMALMSQSGQYNYDRCCQRNDYPAAYLACGEFIKVALSMIYILNKKYMPFYKWAFRGTENFATLREVPDMLKRLALTHDSPETSKFKINIIEEVCIKVKAELKTQGIIIGDDDFLNSHASYTMSLIKDEKIRHLPVMYDVK